MKHLLLTTIAAVVLVGCGNPDGALIQAAKDGNIEAVKQHLAAGADVNAKNESGYTPLHHAAVDGRKEIAELLIAQGADVNAKIADGYTPLDTAINYNQSEITALLRKHGGKTKKELEPAKPEPPTAKALDISIHEAAYRGNIETVKQHLAVGTDVNAKNRYGATPLNYATSSANWEIAELLIVKGADVNAKNEDGGIPLHHAAESGYKEIVELLIAEGANVNAKDGRGKTPLDKTMYFSRTATADLQRPYIETAKLLRQHGGKTGKGLKAQGKPIEPVAVAATSKPEPKTVKAPSISIHGAAEEGNIEAVKQHLAAGMDVNAKTPNGWTPLLKAISFAQKETIELLIAKGANVNAKNDVGETPLHYVAFVGQKEIPKEIAELLIAKGADVNAKNVDGVTPLDVAINDDVAEIEIADLLRKHGGKTSEELKAEGN